MADSNRDKQDKLTMEESVGRLRQVQLGLKQVAANLHRRIELFESESQLHDSLENVKMDAEIRASNLESEVKQLRGDIQTIKELLGYESKQKEPPDS